MIYKVSIIPNTVTAETAAAPKTCGRICDKWESVRFDWLTLALASPMRSGKLYVEHPSGAMPSFLNGVWNVAVSDAMIVSVSDAVGWWCVSVCYSSTARDWMHFK